LSIFWVTVKSILLEEKEHLNEMRANLQQMPSGMTYAEQISLFEGKLCGKWLKDIERDIFSN
jgi:hypothetical protein